MLHGYDLLGAFVFRLSGALLAAHERMDVFGMSVLAIAAGLGGGIVRDVLADDSPAGGEGEPKATIATAIAAGVA
jgi:uncharacterized membrane protein YeiH